MSSALRKLSSIIGLYPLGVSSTPVHCKNQNCLQTLPKNVCGKLAPLKKNHSRRNSIGCFNCYIFCFKVLINKIIRLKEQRQVTRRRDHQHQFTKKNNLFGYSSFSISMFKDIILQCIHMRQSNEMCLEIYFRRFTYKSLGKAIKIFRLCHHSESKTP